VLLRRAGEHAESIVCASVGLMFLVYNAAYFLPFGGWGPGPRFLVGAIPFLLVPVAAALAALPYATTALGVCSALVMVLANAVAPIVPEGRSIGFWLGRARVGDFTETLLTRAGWDHGWAAIAPLLLLVVAALVLAAAANIRERPAVRELLAASAAVGGWLILLGTTPELLRSDRLHGTAGGAIATVAIACGLALAFRLVVTRGLSGFLTAVPFALVALPGFAVHTKWSLLVSVAGLAVAAALSLRPGSRAVPV
jgi:hypothetical protein